MLVDADCCINFRPADGADDISEHECYDLWIEANGLLDEGTNFLSFVDETGKLNI